VNAEPEAERRCLRCDQRLIRLQSMTLTSRSLGIRVFGLGEGFTALPVVVWTCARCKHVELVYDGDEVRPS
jgi:hypothetical protein